MREWSSLLLRDAIEIKHGYAFKGDFFSEAGPGPLLITPGNFAIGGGFRRGKAKYYLGQVPEGFTLQSGDLVVTMTDLSKGGDTLGYPAIIPDGARYLHNQRIGLVRVMRPDLVDSSFLYYVLQTSGYRDHVLSGATGSTVRHTSPSRIYEYSQVMPGLKEQQEIAGVLGVLDEKIANNERIAQSAQSLSELYFERATQGVAMAPLASLATPILGATPDRNNSEYWGPGVPWASAKDVAACSFGALSSTEEEITVEAASVTRAKPVPVGSVILTARGTVGCVARVTRSMALNQSCYAFVSDILPPAALYMTIRWAARSMLSVAHGTVFSTVNMKTFHHVFAPRLDEGSVGEIQDRVESLFDVIDARIEENKSLCRLRDTLLSKLMSGEIRVRDAEREVENGL
jgi:type I restriction enzyme S subunit